MWRQVYARLRSLSRWRNQESELDDEIHFHLAEEMEERIAAGMSPEQARTAARRDFGNVPLIRELTRETWGWGAAERLGQDARSAVRMMRRNPGYTGAVVVTLALGIGLNAAMYGLLSRLFLQAPPHIQNPAGVHRVYVRQLSSFSGQISTVNRMEWGEFAALRADSARFAAVAGATNPRTMPYGRGQAAENLHVSWVTGEFFVLLGVRAALGRLIGPEDDDLAATPVALIGDGYARRRFGLAREALGATVSFDDVTYEIVGVLPPGFSGPDPSAADVCALRIADREAGARLGGSGRILRHAVRAGLAPADPRKPPPRPRPPRCAPRALTRRFRKTSTTGRRPRCWAHSCGPADRPRLRGTCGCPSSSGASPSSCSSWLSPTSPTC